MIMKLIKRKSIHSIAKTELMAASRALLKSHSAHEEAECLVQMFTKRISRLEAMNRLATDHSLIRLISDEIYESQVKLMEANSAMEYAASDILYNSTREARLMNDTRDKVKFPTIDVNAR